MAGRIREPAGESRAQAEAAERDWAGGPVKRNPSYNGESFHASLNARQFTPAPSIIAKPKPSLIGRLFRRKAA